MAAWWWVLIVAAALNGAVVGYGALWFQLFGDRPDRSDFLVSAGGYGAGAAVLLLGCIGVVGLGGPRSAGLAAGMLSLVLGAFAVDSAVAALRMPREELGESPLDGAGGVLLMPWAWVLSLAGAAGAYHIVTGWRRTEDGRPPR